MTCGIYLIDTHIDGWFYIGESNNIEGRWKVHQRKEQKRKMPLNSHYSNFKRKYGTSSWTMTVLYECQPCEFDLCETLTVRASRLAGLKLLNANNGGRGGKGQPKTRKHAEKIRAALTGRSKTPEHCAAMSRGGKGKVLSEEHKRKIGLAGRGHIVSDETREKLSAMNDRRWAAYHATHSRVRPAQVAVADCAASVVAAGEVDSADASAGAGPSTATSEVNK